MKLNQCAPGQHSSKEIRTYLESIVEISSEKFTVQVDVLRGIRWDLQTMDPRARVMNVLKIGCYDMDELMKNFLRKN